MKKIKIILKAYRLYKYHLNQYNYWYSEVYYSYPTMDTADEYNEMIFQLNWHGNFYNKLANIIFGNFIAKRLFVSIF